MVRCLLLAALCLSSPLTCASQNINGEATYISFSVLGAQGTIPLAINASGTVTGYYYASPSLVRGFLRTADGTISTFDVMGGVWTQPKSINAKGDIAGFYDLILEGAHQVTQGFLRYANGRIVTIGPPGQTTTPTRLVSMTSTRLRETTFPTVFLRLPGPPERGTRFRYSFRRRTPWQRRSTRAGLWSVR